MRSRSPSTAGSLRLATNQCQARSTVYLTVPLATNREIPPGVAMADSSRAADARTECDGRIDAPTLSEGGVEMVVPESYRFPHEANRALVQVILAVRDRMLGSGRGVA